jgi:hypothetical protein
LGLSGYSWTIVRALYERARLGDKILRRLLRAHAGVGAFGKAFFKAKLFALPGKVGGQLFLDGGPPLGGQIIQQIRNKFVGHRGCPFRGPFDETKKTSLPRGAAGLSLVGLLRRAPQRATRRWLA